MKTLIIASNNSNKIKEIKDILKNYNFDIKSLEEVNIKIDIEENGLTFSENALIKARTIFNMCDNCAVLADDSGLEVDFLNGEPGIYSARYSGEHGNDEKNNLLLLKNLTNVPMEKRNARFVCSIALIINNETIIQADGFVEGAILEELVGKEGFGYDPLFYVSQYKKTFGQLSMEEKSTLSHRGMALRIMKEKLDNHVKLSNYNK